MKMKNYFVIIFTLFTALVLYDPVLYGAGAQNMQIEWDYPAPPADLAGFRLYVDKNMVQGVAVPTARSWSGPVMMEEGAHAFNMTAYDTDGNESGYSNTVDFNYDAIMGTAPGLIKIKVVVEYSASE